MNALNMESLVDKLKFIASYIEAESPYDNNPQFPNGHCDISSQLIRDVLGFQMVKGDFVRGNWDGICITLKKELHYWNVSDLAPEGKIIDITARQFDETLPEVYIIDKNSPIARAQYRQQKVIKFWD